MDLSGTTTTAKLTADSTTQSQCIFCGEIHCYSECNLIKITNHVPDTEIPTKAKLTLPNFLRLEVLVDGTYSVVTTAAIAKGTRFGPFVASRIKGEAPTQPMSAFPLKIFTPSSQTSHQDDDVPDYYYLETGDENACNWMMFVGCAEYVEDQNLICYQDDDYIYYLAIKCIDVNSALRVWYAPYYAEKMGRSILSSRQRQEDALKNIDVNKLIRKQQRIIEKKLWTCKYCSQVENEIIPFAHHMRKHYIAQLRNTCEICNHSCNSRKSLKNHQKIVHNTPVSLTLTQTAVKNAKTKQTVNNEKDVSVGGPLLNDLFNCDSLDNSNLLLQSTSIINQFDITSNIDNQNHLFLDSDVNNLNVENLLNETVKGFDHFNFEIVDSQIKQYVCDICLKQFTKLKYLILHLKHHTADYMCQKCYKIFCRKDNLLQHSCTVTATAWPCHLCTRSFPLKKYLTRHLSGAHDRIHVCINCNKSYHSSTELAVHNCDGVPNADKTHFICSICNKTFFRNSYLKRHMKTHYARNGKQKPDSMVCEICGLHLLSKNSQYFHMKTHGKPMYSCDRCERAFYRKDALNNHCRNVHSEDGEKFSCTFCDNTLKSKKVLATHMKRHTMLKDKMHVCSFCKHGYKHRSSLTAHMKYHCKSDQNAIKTTSGRCSYKCPVCSKQMTLRSSFRRHMKNQHAEVQIDVSDVSSVVVMENNKIKSGNNNNNNIETAAVKTDVGKIRQIHIESVEENGKINYKKASQPPLILGNVLLNNNNSDVTNFSLENYLTNSLNNSIDKELLSMSEGGNNADATQICLSIPDLTETDQEITLGRNAYILENGTIIQPQENSDNVVIYVLNDTFSATK